MMHPMSSGFDVVEQHNLGITSDGRWVIRELNFAIAPGELVPVLSDGTPAATRVLLEFAGVLPAREGRVDIAGGRRSVGVGYSPELDQIDPCLTPLELCRDVGTGVGLKEPLNQAWIELQTVGLAAFAQVPASELDSAGMVRLGIALALLQGPRVIVVPTLGFESGAEAGPQWELLFYLCSLGYAVVVGCQEAHPSCPVVVDLRRSMPLPPGFTDDQGQAWADPNAYLAEGVVGVEAGYPAEMYGQAPEFYPDPNYGATGYPPGGYVPGEYSAQYPVDYPAQYPTEHPDQFQQYPGSQVAGPSAEQSPQESPFAPAPPPSSGPPPEGPADEQGGAS